MASPELGRVKAYLDSLNLGPVSGGDARAPWDRGIGDGEPARGTPQRGLPPELTPAPATGRPPPQELEQIRASMQSVQPISPPVDPDYKALYDHVMTLSKVRGQ